VRERRGGGAQQRDQVRLAEYWQARGGGMDSGGGGSWVAFGRGGVAEQ
jgi:hypothetical protein